MKGVFEPPRGGYDPLHLNRGRLPRERAVYGRPFEKLLVLCVGFHMALPAEAIASPAEPPAYEAYMRSAVERLEAGEPDHLRAAQDYENAYEAMSQELRVGEMGQFVVAEIVRLYWEELWPAKQELAHLRACRDLLQEYFDELDRARGEQRPTSAPNDVEINLRRTLDDVEAAIETKQQEIIAKEEEAARAVEETKAEEGRDVKPNQAPPQPSPRQKKQRDVLGLSLVGVGAAISAGGAALLVDGLLFPSMIADAKAKQRRIDEEEGDLLPSDPDPTIYVEHEEKMRRRGTIILITGASTLAVGVGLLAWGSIRLMRHRRKASNVALHMSPVFSSRVAGLEIRLHF